MLEEFTGFGSRDFRSRYTNSYGYYTVPGSGKKVLVFMEVVDDREASFKDQKGNKYSANADTGVVFDFIPVRKKLFISEDELYLIERKPARQWARGINSANTRLSLVNRGAAIGLSFKRIVASLEPAQYQHVGAIRLLSDQFAICNGVVFIYDKAIGKWNQDTKTIALESRLFIQELQDLVSRLGKNWKVVCENNT